jgi:hypothetical protein
MTTELLSPCHSYIFNFNVLVGEAPCVGKHAHGLSECRHE